MKKLLIVLIMLFEAFGVKSQWIAQSTGFSTANREIRSISIVNSNIAWASAIDGTNSSSVQEFTKTINGGNTWTPGTISFTGSTTCGIANLHAISNQLCFAAMYPWSASNGGYIAKTTNGGTTWSITNSPGGS